MRILVKDINMKIRFIALLALTALTSLSCQKKESNSQEPPARQQTQQRTQMQHPPIDAANILTGVVQEVIQVSSYTYLKVKEGDVESWIAIPKTNIAVGEKISYGNVQEMPNFYSKELQRTFEMVYFVSAVRRESEPVADNRQPHPQKAAAEKLEISIEPAAGGISIGQLFSNRNSYAGKTVRIKGQVVKVNLAIMKRNWVHLQDGAGETENYDLLVTTQDDVAIGDVVTFEGVIALKKDFGAGYAYDVLMESAKLLTD